MPHELTIKEAADELGVHYMTAYRYVRLGRLPARKDGATWRILSSDVDQLRSGYQDTGSVGDGAPPRAGRVAWAERYESRLLAGDGTGAWGVLEAAMASGTDMEHLYLDVIGPAMESVGRRWAAGEIDVADEHQASAITMRAIGRLGPRFIRRGRTRMSVVVGGVPGELHSLPVALLADLVAGAGFHVVDLGADVPAESFVQAGHSTARLGAFGISMTAPDLDDPAGDAVTAIHTAFPRIPVLAGGGAIGDEAHARRLGADFWARDGRAAVEILDGLASARRW